MLSRIPTPHWHSFEAYSAFLSLGERGDEHHPASPETLLGGWQAELQQVRDLGHGPPLDIVEHHNRAVDERQARQRVLKLLTGLGPLGHDRSVDGLVVVVPPLLHLFRQDVASRSASGVDREVLDDAAQL